MTLVRWSPSSELQPMRRLFDRFLSDDLLNTTDWPEWAGNGFNAIPLDIVEEGDNLVVTAAVPGIAPDDLHVEVQDNVLSIWGETSQTEEKRNGNNQSYFIREQRYGRFERKVRLPYAVDAAKIDAQAKDGMLTLTMPKQSAEVSKRIKVRLAK